jgi:carboxymethylenebutenolidase
MCFQFDALPPDLPADLALPAAAGGAPAELLELVSADGTHFSAALAGSPEPKGPGVIVLPDVRGLYPFYVELAERFAQAGHHAIAIDYFGRTAGLGPRDEEFDYMPHVMETRAEQIQADAAAARDVLRDRTGVGSFASVGFCFGGRHSFLAAASAGLGLGAAVGFYGSLAPRPGMPAPIEVAHETRCPVLGLFGGADDHIPQDQIDAFDHALDEAGVDHEIVVYPGAPHSFFDRRQEDFEEASEDAWRRVLGFIERVGAPA